MFKVQDLGVDHVCESYERQRGSSMTPDLFVYRHIALLFL